MNRAALYSILYRLRNGIRLLAKVFAWLFGIQVALLSLMAIGADAPLPLTSSPALRFAAAIAVLVIVPRLFDLALNRFSTARSKA